MHVFHEGRKGTSAIRLKARRRIVTELPNQVRPPASNIVPRHNDRVRNKDGGVRMIPHSIYSIAANQRGIHTHQHLKLFFDSQLLRNDLLAPCLNVSYESPWRNLKTGSATESKAVRSVDSFRNQSSKYPLAADSPFRTDGVFSGDVRTF